MNTVTSRLVGSLALTALMLAGCMSQPQQGSSSRSAGKDWTESTLSAALGAPTRPQADKDRDADRKPAQQLLFLGVKPGMTALDAVAIGGYITEALAIAVGPQGKVYSQNPPAVYQLQNGIYKPQVEARHANNRLPNVVRVDLDLPATAQIPAGSVDVAVTAQNFHDIYFLIGPPAAQQFLEGIYATLKPGGALLLTDHVGNDNANNAQLHRIPKHIAVETAKKVGFVVESESNALANAADDHTKMVFDPTLRGKTDQFMLLLRKPKK